MSILPGQVASECRDPSSSSDADHVRRGSVVVSRSVRTMWVGTMPMSNRARTIARPRALWPPNPKHHRPVQPKARPISTETNAPGSVTDERITDRKTIAHSPAHPQRTERIDCASPEAVKSAARTTNRMLTPMTTPLRVPWVAIARSTLSGAVRDSGSRRANEERAIPPMAAPTEVASAWVIERSRRRSAREETTAMGVVRTIIPSMKLTGSSRILLMTWNCMTSIVTPRVVALATTPRAQTAMMPRVHTATSTRSSRLRVVVTVRSAM